MNRKIGAPVLTIALLTALVALFFISLTHGSVTIPLKETVNILMGKGAEQATSEHIIRNLRFPRILGGIITGAALAASGMVYQGLFRNVMSDPFVLGISSGAAFSVSLGAYLGIVTGAAGTYVIPMVACLGALLTSLLIFFISGGLRNSTTTLLLTGVALNFLLSALMTLFLYLNRTQLHAILQWTMGSFVSSTWTKVGILTVTSLIGIAPLFFLTHEMDLLLLDEESAHSMGLSMRRTRILLLILCTISTSATVAFFGIIGFVGLMVPHIMRLVVGPLHRKLLPLTLIGGAIMVLVSDLIARTAIAPTELPVGVITSIAGTPLFLILLVRSRRGL